MFEAITSNFESAWKIIIRPPRSTYTLSDLGPNYFTIDSYDIHRNDFFITNKRGHSLSCSFYQITNPLTLNHPFPRPCVIYLHCNAGCRLEGMQYSEYLLQKGIQFFTFDFSGCGNSEGEYVSLGVYESEDLELIIKYIRKKLGIKYIALWGRSMGAATAIKYAVLDPELCGIILDSPFFSLKTLALELAKEKTGVPNWILKTALIIVEKKVKEKANFTFKDLKLKYSARKSEIPAIFVTSKEDKMVGIHHVEKLFKEYKGEKKLICVFGGHCEDRGKDFIDNILKFLLEKFTDNILNKEKNKIEILKKSDTQIIFKDFKNKEFSDEEEINKEENNAPLFLKNKILNSVRNNLNIKEIIKQYKFDNKGLNEYSKPFELKSERSHEKNKSLDLTKMKFNETGQIPNSSRFNLNYY